MGHKIVLFLVFGAFLGLQTNICLADRVVVSHKTEQEPVVDGLGGDTAWENIETFTTFDPIANIELELKSLHTDKKIFFLVQFADETESIEHKMWHWNKETEMYDEGPEREDSFVFKWAISDGVKDLTLQTDFSYDADVWYWKSCRTGPEGYADDKIQRLSSLQSKTAKKIISPTGGTMFLQRDGDEGKGSYKTEIYPDYEEDIMPRYVTLKPEGSRADILAQGHWENGRWTIEFARLLVTGNDDDVNFTDMNKSYRFGVSRYEVAGRDPEPNIEAPLFGSGEITEHLLLQFK